MMPILYKPKTIDFNNMGIGVLSDTISCFVDEDSTTGEYELEMTYLKGGQFYDEIKYGTTIKAKPRENVDPQLFDVYDIVEKMGGHVEIYARHVKFRLNGMPVKPYTATSLANALKGIDTNAYGGATGFTFYTDKTSATDYKLSVPRSAGDILRGVEGSILDVYGGKYSYDNFTVKLLNKLGEDRGVVIRHGKNLTDLTVETEGVAPTGVLGYWHNDRDGLVRMDSVVKVSNENNFPYKYHEVMDFSQDFQKKPTKAQLTSLAQKKLGSGNPNVSYDIEFKPLYKSKDYEQFRNFERIDMGDTVRVVHPAMGVDTKAIVYRIRYNVLTEEYEKISVGSYKESLAGALARMDINSATKNTELAIGDYEDSTGTVNLTSGTSGTVCTTNVLTSGLYLITAEANFDTNATGRRTVSLAAQSGSSWVTDDLATSISNAVSGVRTRGHITFVVSLTTDTTYGLRAYQNSGSTLSCSGTIRVLKLSA